MSKASGRVAAWAFATLLALSLVPHGAQAQSEELPNSWRYQDGEPVATEAVEEALEEGLTAMAQFVMWTRGENGYYVSSNGKDIPGALRRGIDISEFNEVSDWSKIQADDISFVIIRVGFSGTSSHNQFLDEYFERHVAACEELGIPYGVYFFSAARSVADAEKEAAFTVKALKGHTPTLPVYYDLEWEDVGKVSNRKLLADISTIFCETVAAAGYTPGVYANTTWWEQYLTDECFERWSRWVAQYYSTCEYEGTYDIWQCTSVATIKGMYGSSNTDLNLDFRGEWGQGGSWVEEGAGWRYLYDDGTYASGTLADIGGAIYTFDANDVALTGWQKIGQDWYYFNPDTRAMARGLLVLGNKTYWMDPYTGKMASGWAKYGSDAWIYLDPADSTLVKGRKFTVGGKTYIADENGECPVNGWVRLDGKWYRTNASCAVVTGWAKVSGTWYYLDPKTGIMKDSELFTVGSATYLAKSGGACPAGQLVKLGGAYYLTNESCAICMGWAEHDGNKVYLDPETGVMKRSETFTVDGVIYQADENGAVTVSPAALTQPQAGWVSSSGRWRYRLADDVYLTSQLAQISGSWYCFDDDGWMVTGWLQMDGKWYWFAKSGARKENGWVSGTYYMGSDGAMLTSSKTPDGYYVGADGKWVRPGWKKSGTRWWYMNQDGSYPASQFLKVSSRWYYFDASGWMVTGWRKVGGTWYWFDSSGAMATGWKKISGKWYWFASSGAMLANGTTPDGYRVGADGAMLTT